MCPSFTVSGYTLVSRIFGPSIEHFALVYRLVLLSETHVCPEMHPMRKWRIRQKIARSLAKMEKEILRCTPCKEAKLTKMANVAKRVPCRVIILTKIANLTKNRQGCGENLNEVLQEALLLKQRS